MMRMMVVDVDVDEEEEEEEDCHMDRRDAHAKGLEVGEQGFHATKKARGGMRGNDPAILVEDVT